MTSKRISCPNCDGPVEPNSTDVTLCCPFCHQYFENPLYRIPRPPSPTPPKTSSKTGAIVAAAIFGSLVMVVAVSAILIQQAAPPPVPANPLVIRLSPATEVPAATKISPDEALRQKLDAYTECIEWVYPRMQNAEARYLAWVKDPKKGPTCKERLVSWGIFALIDHSADDCFKKIAAAALLPMPLPDLDQSMKRFAETTQSLEPILKEASQYYDQDLYNLDDCAKGQKLHPMMMSLIENMKSLYAVIFQQIEHYGRGSMDRCLQRTATDPQMIIIHRWTTVVKRGQEAVNFFREESRQKNPALEGIKQKVLAFTESSTDLQSAIEADKSKYSDIRVDKWAINDFMGACTAFLTSKAGKSLSSTSRFFKRNGSELSTLEGTFEYVIAKFNKVIENYNSHSICGDLLPCTVARCPDR